MNDTELEDQLTTLFERRATDVRTIPAFDFSHSDNGRTRLNLTPFAIAASIAAVVLVAGGSVVGIRSIHHPSPATSAVSHMTPQTVAHPPTPTPTCRINPRTTWKTPIENGTNVPLDHPDNSVVSANGSIGEYLLLQTTPANSHSAAVFGQATLAIFQGTTGHDIAVLPTGSTDLPVVDPAGAITSDWIAYGIAPPQNGGTYYKVMLYNRHTQSTITVAELSDSAVQSGQIFSAPPVIFSGKLYWISSIYSDLSKSKLESYDLQTGARTATPVPGATALIYYGTGVASISGYDTNSTFTTRLGAKLPSTVVTALRGLTDVSYSAPAAGQAGSGVLHWVGPITDRGKLMTAFYTNQVGSPGLYYGESTKYSFDLGVGTEPFLPVSPISDGPNGVLEGRMPLTGTHSLPDGDVLQATVGDTAIFGTGTTKSGSTGLVLVKISSLPREIAGC